jgi:hypothetical protein
MHWKDDHTQNFGNPNGIDGTEDNPWNDVVTAITFIHQQIQSGRNVLVHCRKGRSRSATMCIAYLMVVWSMTRDKALAYITALRPCVSPNYHFIGQLFMFEKSITLQKLRVQYANDVQDTVVPIPASPLMLSTKFAPKSSGKKKNQLSISQQRQQQSSSQTSCQTLEESMLPPFQMDEELDCSSRTSSTDSTNIAHSFSTFQSTVSLPQYSASSLSKPVPVSLHIPASVYESSSDSSSSECSSDSNSSDGTSDEDEAFDQDDDNDNGNDKDNDNDNDNDDDYDNDGGEKQ